MTPIRYPLCAAALAAAVSVVGCGSSGGGGGGNPAPGHVASAAAGAHWNVALAALGTNYTPASPTVDPAGMAAWSARLADSWPAFKSWIDPEIETRIRDRIAQITPPNGALRSLAIQSFAMDTNAPPVFSGDAGGRTARGDLGPWSLRIGLEVSAITQLSIGPIGVGVGVTLDVLVEVLDIRSTGLVELDLARPERPEPLRADLPTLGLRLVLSSTSPVLQQISGPLTTILDPLIRDALILEAANIQQSLAGFLSRLPNTPHGLGGGPLGPTPVPVDLAAFAERIAIDCQRDHIPFGNVVGVRFSLPGSGNGVPVDYVDFGDSSLWTGHYICAEAMRYDRTGDPRALAGAARALEGARRCLDVPGRGGLLARAVAPVGHPMGFNSSFVGMSGGVAYNCQGHISRDQYIGCILGLVSAYTKIPPLRAQAGELLSRICAYGQSTGWIATELDGVRLSTPFTQAPDMMWSVIQGGNLADPARFGLLHAQTRDITKILWLPMWVSTRELLDAYFPVNILHGTMATLVQAETDPALYRDYIKGFEIARDVTAHHYNAWFDAVWGMAVPSQAPAAGVLVQSALEHFAMRDRRESTPDTRSDPTVAKVFYVPPAQVTINGTPSNGFWVAAEPLPVEKRRFSDFIWQQSPFHLSSGGSNPYIEQPGVDMLAPYWMARAYGMIP